MPTVSLPLVVNSKCSPLPCQMLRFPLKSYGKEPQQSVSKRGRAKRIPTNEHTENNKTIMTKSTIRC